MATTGFMEMTSGEMMLVDGGDWTKVLAGVVGGVLVANALPISIGVGIGGTPAMGISAFGVCLYLGGMLLDYSSK